MCILNLMTMINPLLLKNSPERSSCVGVLPTPVENNDGANG